MQHPAPTLLMFLGIIALAACADADREPDVASPSTSNQAMGAEQSSQTQEVDMGNQLPETLELEQAIAMAREDMASRMSIAAQAIETVAARPVTWSNGAIGCPEPGMMYTQALVPGYFIHLRHDNKDAHYHAGRDGRPMYCPAERSQLPVDSGRSNGNDRT